VVERSFHDKNSSEKFTMIFRREIYKRRLASEMALLFQNKLLYDKVVIFPNKNFNFIGKPFMAATELD
jgi:hypothetical protein